MVNTMFATADDLLNHIITPLPLGRGGRADLFREFQTSGYLARQENVGITVASKQPLVNGYTAAAENGIEHSGSVHAVMLSHPSMPDDEFDTWVATVRDWSAGLSLDARTAYSRKIRDIKKVPDGVPLTELHKSMPMSLVLSYRRPGDFVAVIDSWGRGKRRIFATKNIDWAGHEDASPR